MKKRLLCALVALAGVSVDVSAGSPFPYNFNVTNNTTKPIAVRFKGVTEGLARILNPGQTKPFYPSCAFNISIANIDTTPDSTITVIDMGGKMLDAYVSSGYEDKVYSVLTEYRYGTDYTSAVNLLTFKSVPVDNKPTDPNVCSANDIFNFTVSEDGGTYKVRFESASSSAKLKSLSTPAIDLTGGTASAS